MRLLSLLFVNLILSGSGFSMLPNAGLSKHVMFSNKAVDVDVDVDVDVPLPCSENEEPDMGNGEPMSVLFYPGKLNRMIPHEFYSDFLARLRKHRHVYVANDSSVDDDSFIKDIAKNNGVCVVSHSTSANDAIALCKSIDEGFVQNVVLIDPIDYLFFKNDFNPGMFGILDMFEGAEDFEEKISEFIESNKFELLLKTVFGKKDVGMRKIKSKVLVLNSRLSKRWKVLPPIPPISKYSVDLKQLRNKDVRVVDDYGHFDILDARWATMMHNTISKGAASRETDNIDAYHSILVDMINEELSLSSSSSGGEKLSANADADADSV